jgi:putative ABC transport system permease protein
MTRFLDPLLSAWASVIAHKLRSFLTVLGIVIGVAAVIALLAIGQGAQAQIISSIESLGANLVQVYPGSSFGPGGVRGGATQTLTLEDAAAIEEQISNVVAVAPVISSHAQIIAGNENTSASVSGTTPAYRIAYNLELDSGTFFSDYDYDRAAKVAVLGPTVAEDLFGQADPTGQTMKVNGTIVHVIGVLKEKGASMTAFSCLSHCCNRQPPNSVQPRVTTSSASSRSAWMTATCRQRRLQPLRAC